jgi:TIR domain
MGHAVEYEYDVFLSYRRAGDWPGWVENAFLRVFRHWLDEELGHPARIFVDQEMDTGTSWPDRLALALARSRVLVPLFSRQYFDSRWCKMEFAVMCERENRCGFGTPGNPHRLIVPAQIHDGDDIPAEARCIQAAPLQDCADPFMRENSLKWDRLSERINTWVPDVKAAIRRAPQCDPGWVALAGSAFTRLFESVGATQETPPSLAEL